MSKKSEIDNKLTYWLTIVIATLSLVLIALSSLFIGYIVSGILAVIVLIFYTFMLYIAPKIRLKLVRNKFKKNIKDVIIVEGKVLSRKYFEDTHSTGIIFNVPKRKIVVQVENKKYILHSNKQFSVGDDATICIIENLKYKYAISKQELAEIKKDLR